MIRIAAATLALLLSATALAQSPAVSPAVSPEERAKFEQVIRDFITANPAFIKEQLDRLEEETRVAQAAARQKLIGEHRATIFESKVAPVAGNPQGDVVLVEWFDYRCGYCKLIKPTIEKVVEGDGQVKVIHKHLPVLGSASVAASRAALAARNQGKYAELHEALMNHQGRMDQDTVMALAKAAGLDTERLEREMDAPEITAELDANRKVAQSLRIRGTPSFIVGDVIQVGTVDEDRLKRWIGEARKGG